MPNGTESGGNITTTVNKDRQAWANERSTSLDVYCGMLKDVDALKYSFISYGPT